MLLLVAIPLSAGAAALTLGTHKVVVQSSDATTLADLARGGGTKLVDYGSFSLWRVPDAQYPTLARRASVTPADEFATIYLRGASIATPRGAAPVPSALRQNRTSGAQFWMVQFTFRVSPTHPCGTPIALTESVTYAGGGSFTNTVSLPTSEGGSICGRIPARPSQASARRVAPRRGTQPSP